MDDARHTLHSGRAGQFAMTDQSSDAHEWSGVVDPDHTPAGLLLDLKGRTEEDLSLERIALRAFHAANPHLGPPPFERGSSVA